MPIGAPQQQPQPGQVPGQPTAPQPPFGQTPATQPTANRGAEAAAMQKLAMAVKLLGDAFVQAGATSELGQGIMKHLSGLAKLVPVGASTPATERNGVEQMALKNAQQNQMMQQMAQQRAMAQQQGGQQQQMPRAA